MHIAVLDIELCKFILYYLCCEENKNSNSFVFFRWLNPLFQTGYKRRLEVEDMYNVCEQDDSEKLGDRLEM